MKMTSLQKLHKSMMMIQAEMQQFRIDLGAVSFDCLFSIRDQPNFTLALTSRGISPKFFLFDVLPGYWIAPYFDRFYFELADVLNTGAESGNPLRPKTFLDQLNKSIPILASSRASPSTNEIIRLRPDIVEHRDRPYFDCWVYWHAEGRGQSAENRQKTQLLLGTAAKDYGVRMNASSKWSAFNLNKSWDDYLK